MSAWKTVRSGGLGLAWAAALLAAQGCASYWQHRGRDALQMADIGVTVTRTPYFSLYGCGLDVMTFGAGHVDGHLIGIGGGEFGVVRHYEKTLGLVLWGYEELGWGEDLGEPNPRAAYPQPTLFSQHVAILGWLTELPRRPAYGPA